MNFKKIISVISALAIVITSSLTVHVVSASGDRTFPFPLEDYVGKDIPEGEYGVEGEEKVKYIFTFDDAGTPNAQVSTEYATDGTRSLIMGAKGTANKQQGLGAGFTLKFGDPTANGKYVISFDAWIEGGNYRDYVALNNDGWDGKARLADSSTTTQWTITELGAGQTVGGVGTGTWKRYTATLSTIADDPQLNFALRGDVFHIDNIIIKDTSGNLIFEESFEAAAEVEPTPTPTPTPTPEPEEPREPVIGFPCPFEAYINKYIPTGDYPIEGVEKVSYHIRTNGADTSVAIVRTADASDGTRSFRIRSAATTPIDRTLCTELTLKFGEQTSNGKYVISFDAWREASDSRDYAALNYGDWNGSARLTNTTKWTVTELGKGQDIGGVGTGTWSRYTATLSTIADDPQINFAVAGYGELHLDNIVVKDTSGNLLFADSFEGETVDLEMLDVDKTMAGGVEIASPVEDYVGHNVPAGTYESKTNSAVEYVTTYGTNAYGKVTYGTSAYGNSSFYLRGANYNVGGATGSARITLKLGERTADNKYEISFDASRDNATSSDYATLNEANWSGNAKLTGSTIWQTKSRGTIGAGDREWTHYYATLTTEVDPQLDFSVFGWGEMYIDNIVVKDTAGNIIFQEGFECGAAPSIIDVEYTTVDGETIDSPVRPYIGKNVPQKTFVSERNADVVYTPTYGSSAYAKVSNDVSAYGENSLFIYGANNTAADGKGSSRMTLNIGTKTADNKYVISFDASRNYNTDRDYVALNEIEWSGNARLNSSALWTTSSRGNIGTGDKTWTHYVATLTTEADPQLDFAVFGWGTIYIDNIVVRDTDGNIIFSEGFEGTALPVGMSEIKHTTSGGEIIDCAVEEYIGEEVPAGRIASYKKPTVQYVTTYGTGGYAMIDSTVSAYGENSLMLYGKNNNVGGKTGSARFTLELGERTSDKKYVISFDLCRQATNWQDYISLNERNWDSSARLSSGDMWSRTVLGVAGKGDKEWTHYEATLSTDVDPQIDISVYGWGALYIDNIVVKDTSENIVFSEGFEDSGFVRSTVYDAEFELVEKTGDGYTVVGATDTLTSNTFVKTSVTVENMGALKGAGGNIYTALYKDNLLVSFDAQTVFAAKGETLSSNSVIEIPSLSDGEYTLRVYVWDDDLNALKDAMFIGE